MPTLDDLPTPVLLLDLDRVEANISRMAGRCRALGVALRPHLKTHKCVEIAERQRAAGARGVTVSTLYEARVFADHGFEDVTWAFPIILSRLHEVVDLADRIRLGITIDSVQAARAVERLNRPLHIWLKIDCGYHRAGLDPRASATIDMARRIAGSRALTLDGLLTHSGHAYHGTSREAIRRIAEDERRAVAELRATLEAEGIPVAASVGSTPAMAAAVHLDGVTEARPGNYVFYDATQVALGSCAWADVGVSVLTSVISSQPGAAHCVLDAGALALSKDTGPDTPQTMGRLIDDYDSGTVRSDASITTVSQEHGIVSGRLPVGTRLRVAPNHSCLTVACFDEYAVVRGPEVVDRWKIWRGRS